MITPLIEIHQVYEKRGVYYIDALQNDNGTETTFSPFPIKRSRLIRFVEETELHIDQYENRQVEPLAYFLANVEAVIEQFMIVECLDAYERMVA